MPKLTNTFIDRLPFARTGQIFYRDNELIGFGLRVAIKRKTFICEGRVNGRNVRCTVGKYPLLKAADARKMARQFLGLMAQGIHPHRATEKPQQPESMTLRQIWDEYKTARKLSEKTIYVYDKLLGRCFLDWLERPISCITKNCVEVKHRQLSVLNGVRGTGQSQANLAMRMLSALLTFASDRHEDLCGQPLFRDNPVRRLSQSRLWNREHQRQGVIHPHQLADWHREVMALQRTITRDYLLLLLHTGLRRTEAAKLKWHCVDFESRTITVPAENSKNSHEHRLPMSGYVFELLSARLPSRDESNEFVFPGYGSTGHIIDLRVSQNRVAANSGVIFTLHDLRRSFLSIADRLDISHYALRKLANHQSSPDITERYIVNDVERLRDPVERISAFISQCIRSD